MQPRLKESRARYLSRFMASSTHRDLAPAERVRKAHELYEKSRESDQECKCGGSCGKCGDGQAQTTSASVTKKTETPARSAGPSAQGSLTFRAVMGQFARGELRDGDAPITERNHALRLAMKAARTCRQQHRTMYGDVTRKSATVQEIDAAAAETHANPTAAQKESGNYKKGRVMLHGLPIVIESARGNVRSGTNAQGHSWSRVLAHHYGYVGRTKSDADGDPVDVFLGPNPESLTAYVIDQVKPDGTFDEHKVMLGFASESEARQGYLACYTWGWRGLGAMTPLSIDEFKEWLTDGDTSAPLSPKVKLLQSASLDEMTAKSGWRAVVSRIQSNLTRKSGVVAAAPQSSIVQSLGGALRPFPEMGRSTRKTIERLAPGKYRLYSRKKNPKTGERRNLGTFDSYAAALKHERAVEYFKHAGVDASDLTTKDESFFKTCDRDDKGHCKPGEGSSHDDAGSKNVHLELPEGFRAPKPKPHESQNVHLELSHGKPPSKSPESPKYTTFEIGKKTESAPKKTEPKPETPHETMPLGKKVKSRKILQYQDKTKWRKKNGLPQSFAMAGDSLTVVAHRGGGKSLSEVLVRNKAGDEQWHLASELRPTTISDKRRFDRELRTGRISHRSNPRLTQKSLHPCSACCSCSRCRSSVCLVTYRLPAVAITRKDAHVDLPQRTALIRPNTAKEIKTDDSRMTASCILATSDRDRQGDIIECSGVLFTDHRINPVVLWDHGKMTTIPIGVTEDEDESYTVKYLPDQDLIVQTTYFADTSFSRQIYALVRDRIIRANSIAVKDLEVDRLPPDPAQGHFARRDRDGRVIPFKHILKSMLAEVTWTSLPANPEAVKSLLDRGKIVAGGFNAEPLDDLIRKSLTRHLPRAVRRAWSNGLTLKSLVGAR